MVRWTPLLVGIVVADGAALVLVWGGIFGLLPGVWVWVGAGLAMLGMWGYGKHAEKG